MYLSDTVTPTFQVSLVRSALFTAIYKKSQGRTWKGLSYCRFKVTSIIYSLFTTGALTSCSVNIGITRFLF